MNGSLKPESAMAEIRSLGLWLISSASQLEWTKGMGIDSLTTSVGALMLHSEAVSGGRT
jgi:hypothetical protein